MDRADHWEGVHREKRADEVSWFQATPEPSLSLIRSLSAGGPVVDVGAGASVLVDRLLDEGLRAVTCVDISGEALSRSRARLGSARSALVEWVVADIANWTPEPGRFALWHDRAALHFLTDERARVGYRAAITAGLRPGGHAVISAFSTSGPTRCSGLEIRQYDAERLVETLGGGFELLEHWTQEHRTPAGKTQEFAWFVLRRRGADTRA